MSERIGANVVTSSTHSTTSSKESARLRRRQFSYSLPVVIHLQLLTISGKITMIGLHQGHKMINTKQRDKLVTIHSTGWSQQAENPIVKDMITLRGRRGIDLGLTSLQRSVSICRETHIRGPTAHSTDQVRTKKETSQNLTMKTMLGYHNQQEMATIRISTV